MPIHKTKEVGQISTEVTRIEFITIKRGEQQVKNEALFIYVLGAAWLESCGLVDSVDDTHIGNGVCHARGKGDTSTHGLDKCC